MYPVASWSLPAPNRSSIQVAVASRSQLWGSAASKPTDGIMMVFVKCRCTHDTDGILMILEINITQNRCR